MSLNLHLAFIDKKKRPVHRVDLVQTPTKITTDILGYHPAYSISFEARLERYLKYVESQFDQEIVEYERNKIQQALDTYGDDYEPDWFMM